MSGFLKNNTKQMKRYFIVLLLIGTFAFQHVGFSQTKELDFALAAKNEVAPAVSFNQDYSLGKNKRIKLGYGIRLNTYFSGERAYLTAPALLTSGKQSIAAFFTPYSPEKIDTLTQKRAGIAALNTKINLGYSIGKSEFGFNIDLFGITVGPKQSGSFRASESASLNNTTQTSKPTTFNLLLISDSDIGSLNSELYFKRRLTNDKAIRLGLSFQFIEYTTENILTYENDRFRTKVLMPFVAYSIPLK